ECVCAAFQSTSGSSVANGHRADVGTSSITRRPFYVVCDYGSVDALCEADAVRPDSPRKRRKLNKADDYGDGKLQAEEALADAVTTGEEHYACKHKRSGTSTDNFVTPQLDNFVTPQLPCCKLPFQVVSLRLPDVIGPFDDTGRLWAYWLWLHSGEPILVSDRDAAQPLAVVFSGDVARFIEGLLSLETTTKKGGSFEPEDRSRDHLQSTSSPKQESSRLMGREKFTRTSSLKDDIRAVNLGCTSQPYLQDHLQTLRKCITRRLNKELGARGVANTDKNGSNISSIAAAVSSTYIAPVREAHEASQASKNYKPDEPRPRATPQFLPSVNRMVPLDFSRLREEFDWFQPTLLPEVYAQCDAFFQKAVEKYPSELRHAFRKLPRRVRDKLLVNAPFLKDLAADLASSSDDSTSSSSHSETTSEDETEVKKGI
ncbi:unnamed protein product, partial [Amoebophrya sp. A25]